VGPEGAEVEAREDKPHEREGHDKRKGSAPSRRARRRSLWRSVGRVVPDHARDGT
jgi:hypothetical protein